MSQNPIRELRAKEAARLRAQGMNATRIAEQMGVSRSYAYELLGDPEGIGVRARKDRYRKSCIDCGAKTDGSNGYDAAPERCLRCTSAQMFARHERWLTESLNEWIDLFGVPPTVGDWSPASARQGGTLWRIERMLATGRKWPSHVSAIHHFGSWTDFIRTSGFEPFEAGEYGREGEDPAVVAETVKLYREGLSCAQVGERMGITATGVWDRLVRAGCDRRSSREAARMRREAA